jgi:hypothetical protein
MREALALRFGGDGIVRARGFQPSEVGLQHNHLLLRCTATCDLATVQPRNSVAPAREPVAPAGIDVVCPFNSRNRSQRSPCGHDEHHLRDSWRLHGDLTQPGCCCRCGRCLRGSPSSPAASIWSSGRRPPPSAPRGCPRQRPAARLWSLRRQATRSKHWSVQLVNLQCSQGSALRALAREKCACSA